MFSPNIQNLINTGGKEAALQRVAQISSYVNNLEKSTLDPSKNVVQSFDQVLKASNAADTRFSVSGDSTASEAMQGSWKNISKTQVMDLISKVSNKYDIDEKLVQALVRQESGFRPDAVSKCGAMGLMQLMPGTARGLGVKDPFNPIQNLEGGVRHLKGLLARYHGNVVLALAAYNAGGGNVDKYNGVPPFAETQNYVKSILANYLG